jgi:hypothetical protein
LTRQQDPANKKFDPPTKKRRQGQRPPGGVLFYGFFEIFAVSFGLVARADRTSETTVISPILGVPKRLALTHAFGQHVQLIARSGRALGAVKLITLSGCEVFVMPILQNRFKHIGYIFHFDFHSSNRTYHSLNQPGHTTTQTRSRR